MNRKWCTYWSGVRDDSRDDNFVGSLLLGTLHKIDTRVSAFAIRHDGTFYLLQDGRCHYIDVMMGAMASQVTSLTIVDSSIYSGRSKKIWTWTWTWRKHQSSASLIFVRGIHLWPVNFPHKGPVTRKMSPIDNVFVNVINDDPDIFSPQLPVSLLLFTFCYDMFAPTTVWLSTDVTTNNAMHFRTRRLALNHMKITYNSSDIYCFDGDSRDRSCQTFQYICTDQCNTNNWVE